MVNVELTGHRKYCPKASDPQPFFKNLLVWTVRFCDWLDEIVLCSGILSLPLSSGSIFAPELPGWEQQKGEKVEPSQAASGIHQFYLLLEASVPRKSSSGQFDEFYQGIDRIHSS